MSDQAHELRKIHHEAQSLRIRCYRDNYSIPLQDFDEKIFLPLSDLVNAAHERQLADIRENGT